MLGIIELRNNQYIVLISQFFINRKELKMFEKKQPSFTTPDLTKLQEVIIDVKTRIYIAVGADPKEARSRYLARIGAKKL